MRMKFTVVVQCNRGRTQVFGCWLCWLPAAKVAVIELPKRRGVSGTQAVAIHWRCVASFMCYDSQLPCHSRRVSSMQQFASPAHCKRVSGFSLPNDASVCR